MEQHKAEAHTHGKRRWTTQGKAVDNTRQKVVEHTHTAKGGALPVAQSWKSHLPHALSPMVAAAEMVEVALASYETYYSEHARP